MLLWVIQPVIVGQLVHERASVTLQPVIRGSETVRIRLSPKLNTRSRVTESRVASDAMMESEGRA